MLAAGVPMAVVSKRLGHSTITLTSDTYSHLLGGVGGEAAERAAALVPRAGRAVADDRRDQSVTTSAQETDQDPRLDDGGPGLSGSDGAPPGTRTPNPLVKGLRAPAA
ncbi:MAG: hypothetical protein QOK11_1948 [Pseudonocardiales bacterium]|nr:hypothetical protein [Pseudonocardiales bacterium]